MNSSFFRSHPTIVVAIGVLFSSFASILIRLSTAPALAIASYRLVFTVMLVAPLYLRERSRGIRQEDTTARAPGALAAVLLSVLSGVFLAMHFAFWITSLDYTTVANSTVLVNTHPILVAIAGAVLLGERVRWRSVPFILAAIAGGVLLVTGGFGNGEAAALGNLLAFLGAVTVSGYIIAGRVVRRRLTANAYTIIVYFTTAVSLVVAALAFGTPLWPYETRDVLIFAALALFCTVLGHSLFSWALRYVRPAVLSTSTLGEPVIATTLALILFGEIPTPLRTAGGVAILVSIYLFVRSESRADATVERRPGAEAPEAPSS